MLCSEREDSPPAETYVLRPALCTWVTSPRQLFSSFASYQTAVDERPEQRGSQDPDDGKSGQFQLNLPITRYVYPGDRFIPRRHTHSCPAAYHMLTQQPDDHEDKAEIDYCKQVDLLDAKYRREAMRAMMLSQECVSGLSQKRILQTFVERQGPSDSVTQGYSESETKGKWKCKPRNKRLIGNPESMLSFCSDQNNDTVQIDWSSLDMLAMGDGYNLMTYHGDGRKIDMLRLWGEFTAVKWSNDGLKIACTFRISMQLKYYDLQTKKILWSVPCYCSVCGNYATSCGNTCICWSQNDRRIVIACAKTLSVFRSSTGKLVLRKPAHTANIISLSFSSTFKYLASIAEDKCVRIHTWPDLVEWYSIEFTGVTKSVAWHPEMSGLLCLGGSSEASLSLWNVNTYAMMDYLPAKRPGCVENLAWNKLSGELVVHWSYKEMDERRSVLPVLANFERTVDAIPVGKDKRLSFLKFNSTHRQLVTCCDNVFCTWNFFGDEEPSKGRCLLLYDTAKPGAIFRSAIR